jgi:phosphatidylglycerophosphate synthase
MRRTRIWLVDAISLSRLVAALVFACLALQHVPTFVTASVYAIAMMTDALDGFLARTLSSTTYLGKVVDLVSDKSLTIVSLLYASSRGMDIVPLSIIAVRDMIMIGARLIVVRGTQLLPTSRFVGGILAFAVWGNTLLLVVSRDARDEYQFVNLGYWLCALFAAANGAVRIHRSFSRIRASSEEPG